MAIQDNTILWPHVVGHFLKDWGFLSFQEKSHYSQCHQNCPRSKLKINYKSLCIPTTQTYLNHLSKSIRFQGQDFLTDNSHKFRYFIAPIYQTISVPRSHLSCILYMWCVSWPSLPKLIGFFLSVVSLILQLTRCYKLGGSYYMRFMWTFESPIETVSLNKLYGSFEVIK